MKPLHAHHIMGWFTDPAMYPLLLIVPLPFALGAYCGFQYCVNSPDGSGASFYAHGHDMARLESNAITDVNDAPLPDKNK
ncbi:hypothetical protein SPRG_00272 [Saprolegnia parasitica CBS 223.65]|uniref:Uncharacterized protein n=1 Tax=Saprolegnia parasitica (strain CBS 223.65) TaxID=695850 RepID=A0A067CXI1_SAPPC|nr:hypothetical protein SPRG_00272 [Saprolegnia parasitica CBS 223.65]KDO35424.1 hypothetical protein SPRG_00272 [Saprolegnia parasitica CBS 223.65]|eukprot:XP_012193764.1 hypothetical protein SPRG_00272 [Saprolegnia parasitica CBS 223.65]